MAYWIQIAIALPLFVYTCLARLLRRPALAQQDTEAIPAITKVARESALSAMLVDFHKVQCFYGISAFVAVQIVVRYGTLDSWNLEQIKNNYRFIQHAAIAGFLPVTMTFLNLDLVGKGSWWLLLLSTLSFITSGYTAASSLNLENDIRNMNASAPATFTLCGYVNPAMFCLSSPIAERGISRPGILLILSFSASILIGVLVYRLIVILQGNPDDWGYNLEEYWIWKYWLWIVLCFYLACVGIYMFLLAEPLLAKTLDWSRSGWTFGQVVAVAIWFPSIFEWLHLVLRKFSGRVLSHF